MSRLRRWAPWIAVVLLAVVGCGVLLWPLPLHLASAHWISAFGDSHVWVFEVNRERLLSVDLLGRTCEGGFPVNREMRTLAWVPNLVFLALRPLLGALGAANLVQWLSLPASVLAAGALIRRWTGVPAAHAAAWGLVYGLCPTLLATLAIGEVSNTQGWIFPAFLLALDEAGTRWRGALWTLLATAAAAFTSPYYAAALPLLAVGWAGVRARGGLRDRARLRDLGALVATALPLLVASTYYTAEATGGRASVFQPARRAWVALGPLPEPAPVAQPEALLWPLSAGSGGPLATHHVVYLGLILVVLAAVGAWRGGVGRRRGAMVAGLGLVLAVGPWLATLGAYRGVFGWRIPLPVALLEAVGYPTSTGGMYYRFTVIAVLGLCVLAARALADRSLVWVVLLVGLQVVDSVRASGPWPVVVESVPVAVLQGMRGEDGAVLDLPIAEADVPGVGQAALLRAAIHGRPTTSMPRPFPRTGTRRVRSTIDGALVQGQGAERLRRDGFRYVVFDASVEASGPGPEAIEAVLGTPAVRGPITVWDLGPAATQGICRAPGGEPPDGRGPDGSGGARRRP